MILVILFIGILFVSAASRDKTPELIAVVKDDFTGKDNFFVWALAIGGLYSLGYIKPLAKFSSYFVILVLIAVIVRRKDENGDTFFISFANQLRSTENE